MSLSVRSGEDHRSMRNCHTDGKLSPELMVFWSQRPLSKRRGELVERLDAGFTLSDGLNPGEHVEALTGASHRP
jgi:hypothetical protein